MIDLASLTRLGEKETCRSLESRMKPCNRPFSYMPIMLLKPGECTALRELAPFVRSKILPILEIPPPFGKVGPDGEEIPPPPMDKHLRSRAKKILEAWGISEHIILDTHNIDPLPLPVLGDLTPQEFLFSELRSLRVQAIPMVSPNSDPSFIEVAKRVASTDKRGACIRVWTLDWDKGAIKASLASTLQRICAGLGLTEQDVDLVLDAAFVSEKSAPTEVGYLRLFFEHLPEVAKWRSLVVASCSFPKSLSEFPEHEVHSFKRLDWAVWKELTSSPPTLPRQPQFGDYGINHPGGSLFSMNGPLPTTAQARYTTEEEWICPKGSYINDIYRMGILTRSGEGTGQYVDLAKKLMRHPSFKGKPFSYGDREIEAIGKGRRDPGGPSTWRGIGANHHITLVVQQLEGLSAA